MRRYIVLLLITGIVWAQTDFDKLVLIDGTTYLGEYSKTEGRIVFFKPQGAFAFQPIPVKRIERLELKDGRVAVLNSKVKSLTTEEYFELSRNTLALEEYQKLSTEEKGIYDAKSKNLGKWYLFGPMSTILFVGCIVSYIGITDDFEFWENPIFLVPSSAASLIIPYFVLNNKEKNNFPKSILTDSEKEIYKQTYSKKLRQRKFRYAAVSTTVAVVIVAVAVASFDPMSSSSSGGGGGKGFTGFGP